jgi:hypothetical protein
MRPILINNIAVWTENSPSKLLSTFERPTNSSENNINLSESGWLSWTHGHRRILLWLPVERRGTAWACHERRVMVGANSEAITVLELPTDQP